MKQLTLKYSTWLYTKCELNWERYLGAGFILARFTFSYLHQLLG